VNDPTCSCSYGGGAAHPCRIAPAAMEIAVLLLLLLLLLLMMMLMMMMLMMLILEMLLLLLISIMNLTLMLLIPIMLLLLIPIMQLIDDHRCMWRRRCVIRCLRRVSCRARHQSRRRRRYI
jgi:hypothetical protein